MKILTLPLLSLLTVAAAWCADFAEPEQVPLTKAARYQESLLKAKSVVVRKSASYFANDGVLEIKGFKFYAKEFPVGPHDEIRAMLASSDLLGLFVKTRCEFNANYAVTWLNGQERMDALVCFGCAGIIFYGKGEELRYRFSSRSSADALRAHLVKLAGEPAASAE